MNLDNTIQVLRQNRKGVRFDELVKICDHFFGEARQKATSHRIYKMPWPGDPGVGSSCRFGRQWYAIVAFGSFLVSVVSDVGLW